MSSRVRIAKVWGFIVVMAFLSLVSCVFSTSPTSNSTDLPPGTHPKAGPIIVKVSGLPVETTEKYGFVDSKIKSISPTMGPMNGGTRLTIYGEHLNAGSDVQAFVENIPCQIILKESNRLECRTGSSEHNGRWRVIVKFDQRQVIYEPGFSYVDNPVFSFEKDKPIRGISAGGINVTIEGRNFDAIQEPYMYVLFNGSKYISPCNISGNNTMFCLTPNFRKEPSFYESDRDGREGYIRLPYGFLMDTVNYTAFKNSDDDHPFLLYPNPQYDKFEDEVKMYKSEYLTINGRNLNSATDESDLIVLIGNSICNVTSLSRNQLTCKPPPNQPSDMDDNGRVNSSRSPTVRVKVGKNLTYVIGRLTWSMIFSWRGSFEAYREETKLSLLLPDRIKM